MTEEEFQQQEALRKKVEREKLRLQSGVPELTLEETIPDEHRVFEVKVDNTGIREYIKNEHDELRMVLNSYREQLDKRQNEELSELKSEVATLTDKLHELLDNFNLYVAEEQKDRKLKRERLFATCDKIDKELSY